MVNEDVGGMNWIDPLLNQSCDVGRLGGRLASFAARGQPAFDAIAFNFRAVAC